MGLRIVLKVLNKNVKLKITSNLESTAVRKNNYIYKKITAHFIVNQHPLLDRLDNFYPIKINCVSFKKNELNK